jgi:hypothetical protein
MNPRERHSRSMKIVHPALASVHVNGDAGRDKRS